MDVSEKTPVVERSTTPISEKASLEVKLASSVVAASFLVAASYFYYFMFINPRGAGGPDDWAAFGNFLGGVVNPLVGIATVLLVVKTLQATRAEANDTRLEMRLQTAQLRKQVAHFETQQSLTEIQKRLDGVLSAWNAVMATAAPRVTVGTEDGSREFISDGMSNQQLFNDYTLVSSLAELQGRHLNAAQEDWNNKFNILVQLLEEFDRYCSEYEQVTGNKKLTNYYRHRVQPALRALMAINIVPAEVASRLAVGLNQGIVFVGG